MTKQDPLLLALFHLCRIFSICQIVVSWGQLLSVNIFCVEVSVSSNSLPQMLDMLVIEAVLTAAVAPSFF